MNSKTTIAGILAIIAGLAQLLLTYFDGDPATVASWEQFAVLLGLGGAGAVGIAAKDDK